MSRCRCREDQKLSRVHCPALSVTNPCCRAGVVRSRAFWFGTGAIRSRPFFVWSRSCQKPSFFNRSCLEPGAVLVATGAIRSPELFGWYRSYPKPGSFWLEPELSEAELLCLMPKPKIELLDRLGRWLLSLTVKTKFLLNSSFLPIFFGFTVFFLACFYR